MYLHATIGLLAINIACRVVGLTSSDVAIKSFTIDYHGNCFLKDNIPFRYISGSLHYFRIPRDYWDDRLKKAKALGLNAITTYIAWNKHEPSPGKYDFTGENDLLHFIKLAQDNGLLVILRPGPYIDTEWEFGGFPWWLAKQKYLERSSRDHMYMKHVKNWFSVLLAKIKPVLYKNSGPVIAIQVENEYGDYFACDHYYLEELKKTYDTYLGKDEVVLYTVDGYRLKDLRCGSIASLYKTIDFGIEIEPSDAFKWQRIVQPHGPLVNSEYYTGWVDRWGRSHSRRDSIKVAAHLDAMLRLNASVSLYMYHGGTNFGFMNGAYLDRTGNSYFISTSYDYDAPLTEAGDASKKYIAMRNVIKKYSVHPLPPIPNIAKKGAYGKVKMSRSFDLFHFISQVFPKGAPFRSVSPLTMEEINQGYGYVLYRTIIPHKLRNDNSTLSIDTVHDRSIIFVDGKRQTVVDRGRVDKVDIGSGVQLDILVENQGRITYGPSGTNYFPDPKGIIGNVRLNSDILKNWSMYPLDESMLLHARNVMNQPHIMKEGRTISNVNKLSNMFFTASFTINKTLDTFIKPDGWSKGQIFINSFNVGRYWQVASGPQKTLYIPKTMLNVGTNHLLIVELDKPPCIDRSPQDCSVLFVDKPVLV